MAQVFVGPMPLFDVGQVVIYKAPRGSSAASGAYVIVQQMPREGGVYRYLIRSRDEPHERMANETELVAAQMDGSQLGE